MRTLLLGDIGNRLDIADTEDNIDRLRQEQRRSKQVLASKQQELKSVKEELGRHRLAISALSRFLVIKGIINQDELDEFISEVDAEDGVVDGRMSVNPTTKRLNLEVKEIPSGTFKKMPSAKDE